eukprot:7387344-Prymnesium_polylepis.1
MVPFWFLRLTHGEQHRALRSANTLALAGDRARRVARIVCGATAVLQPPLPLRHPANRRQDLPDGGGGVHVHEAAGDARAPSSRQGVCLRPRKCIEGHEGSLRHGSRRHRGGSQNPFVGAACKSPNTTHAAVGCKGRQ